MRVLSIRELRPELPADRPGAPYGPPRRKRPSHEDLRAAMARLAIGSEVGVRADRDAR